MDLVDGTGASTAALEAMQQKLKACSVTNEDATYAQVHSEHIDIPADATQFNPRAYWN